MYERKQKIVHGRGPSNINLGILATSRCNWSPEEFTRRDRSQGLVPRTVHMKRFEKQVAGTCPKNSNWSEFVGLVAGTKLWSLLATRFWSKNGQFTRWDLSPRLVAGTRLVPSCVPILTITSLCLSLASSHITLVKNKHKHKENKKMFLFLVLRCTPAFSCAYTFV